MRPADPSCFCYQIRPAGDGWAWVAYDLDGQVQARGWAPQKVLAAACVIRALARGATGEAARSAA